ncbi:MAG: hypothetical protein WBG17_05210 [Burkholderiaceae bacterium]
MKQMLLLAIVTTLLIGCSDPRATMLSTADADKEKMQTAMQKITEEERTLVAGYMMRTMLANAFAGKTDTPLGVTIGDAIKKQREWLSAEKKRDAEEAALKAKLAAEEEAFQQQVNGAVAVTVLEKTLLPENFDRRRYSAVQVIKLGFENKSEKDIAGISGEVAFYDIFDKEVGSIIFSYDDGIKAGSTASWTGERKFNEFLREHKALANLEEGKYTTRFKPDTIVFSDGTKLKATRKD